MKNPPRRLPISTFLLSPEPSKMRKNVADGLCGPRGATPGTADEMISGKIPCRIVVVDLRMSIFGLIRCS